MPFGKVVRKVQKSIAKQAKKRRRLQELDLFVLDNSIRESAVAQVRGHTLQNKWDIYNEVKKCGFKFIIVAAFSHMTQVDDNFVVELAERKEDLSNLFALTELIESTQNGIPNAKAIPVGLKKMHALGLVNPIIEIDLAGKSIDWNKFTVQQMCQLLQQRILWSRQNLSKDSKIMISLRDFPDAMTQQMERVFTVVDFLGSLDPEERPFGLMFEEPTGKYLPEEVGAWTAGVRSIMDHRKWRGYLLAHVHEKWAFGEMTQLECLINGADGVWASLCQEGAALGHACSTITLMNLVRMGNKKVLKRYNCTKLREAAAKVTEITTGRPPHPKQVIYGERALDLAFDFGGIAGGAVGESDFDLAEFIGEEAPVRISTLSSVAMIVNRLVNLFGDDPQFYPERGKRMHQVMIDDLKKNRKEEYMSPTGIAILFDRSGGHITESMMNKMGNVPVDSEHEKNLIAKVREIWDEWDLKEDDQIDDAIKFDSFYNGFLAPYFGCFKCDDTLKALQAIDMDEDGYIDWKEFQVYLKWAMHEYPTIADADELLSVAFRKGIIPAMRDEIMQQTFDTAL